jgi:hypothetical protein
LDVEPYHKLALQLQIKIQLKKNLSPQCERSYQDIECNTEVILEEESTASDDASSIDQQFRKLSCSEDPKEALEPTLQTT